MSYSQRDTVDPKYEPRSCAMRWEAFGLGEASVGDHPARFQLPTREGLAQITRRVRAFVWQTTMSRQARRAS